MLNKNLKISEGRIRLVGPVIKIILIFPERNTLKVVFI